MAESLDWTLRGFRRAFAELAEKEMVKADWPARVVWLPNAVKYNEPESPNVVRSWKKAWGEIPESQLKHEALATLKSYLEAMKQGFHEAFLEAFGKDLGQISFKQEQEQEPQLAPASPLHRSPLVARGKQLHSSNKWEL